MDTWSGILWPNLWEGPQELSSVVTSGFKRKDKEGLRGASRAARTAANATVSKVQIAVEDLRDLPQLRLEERFPRIASVSLGGLPQEGIAATFARFAVDTLSKLPKLTSVDLMYCKAFDAASACAALVQCSQLQELSVPQGAEMSQAALGALARLTRLTSLTMNRTKQLDLQGMQQLSSSLQQLQHLDLKGSKGVTDQAVACLAQLKALSMLHLYKCQPLQGSTLGQLSALSGLLELGLGECQLTTIKGLECLPAVECLDLPDELELEPADLARLSALTTLTSLDAGFADITDECSALLRLPSLSWLEVGSISLATVPEPGVLQQLTHLGVYRSGSLATLLPLPQLQHLHLLEEDVEDGSSLVDLVSKQTSLTGLELQGELSEQQMVQMVAPLKQLQSFSAHFCSEETSCLAACAALAELPLLRELKLYSVPKPAHLAMLVRCAQLEELNVYGNKLKQDFTTGLLAALVCKPGLRTFDYWFGAIGASSVDREVLAQIAAQAGVQLAQ